jgi:restriction system protein
MKHNPPKIEMTPGDYEVGVKNVITAKGRHLEDFRVTRRETLRGADGEYEIDVVARFTILEGAELTVLIECKHHKNSIKRELVQALHSKLVSIGAHKAMMFTTANYQRGAIEFAKAHGISLVRFIDSELNYAVKAVLVDAVEMTIDEDGNNSYEVICSGTALRLDLFEHLRTTN